MSNKQQTPVSWLVEQFKKDIIGLEFDYKEEINHALEMEKQQQEYFFRCGRQYQLTGEGTFTEVYNETYGEQNNEQ